MGGLAVGLYFLLTLLSYLCLRIAKFYISLHHSLPPYECMKDSHKYSHEEFRGIYERYFKSLCIYLCCYTPDILAIQDVVQDVFVKLWLTGRVKNTRAWLLEASKNLMLNRLRNDKNRSEILRRWLKESNITSESSLDVHSLEKLLELVENAVETLPPMCREIFIMSKYKNMTYRQIACHLDKSVKTVENQMGIALRKIREYVNEKVSSFV